MNPLRLAERLRNARRLLLQARSEVVAFAVEVYAGARLASLAIVGATMIQSFAPTARRLTVLALAILVLSAHFVLSA